MGEEQRYSVYTTGACVAQHMALGTALLLVEAMFQKYYEDTRNGMEITVRAEKEEEDARP